MSRFLVSGHVFRLCRSQRQLESGRRYVLQVGRIFDRLTIQSRCLYSCLEQFIMSVWIVAMGVMFRVLFCLIVGQSLGEQGAQAAETVGAQVVRFYGYDNCIQLKNQRVRVTIAPTAGGRLLEYSLNGVNALHLPKDGAGWTPGVSKGGCPAPGRFDIGPENTVPAHPQLWQGKWTGQIIGDRAARVTSPRDEATGVQLTRVFRLDAETSKLTCEQSIHNVSQTPREYCHWSRTFAVGGGVCVIPLTQPSRFPKSYVMYTPAPLINFQPVDPQIRVRDGFLEISGPPAHPKLGMDSYAGWFAYLMPHDVMFVKQFPTYPDRVYNEVAGLTMSIWYPNRPMVELEPIGPRERIAPGKSASFTETWWLLPQKFPKAGENANLGEIETAVKQVLPAKSWAH